MAYKTLEEALKTYEVEIEGANISEARNNIKTIENGIETAIKLTAKEMVELGVEITTYSEFKSFCTDNGIIPSQHLYKIYRDAVSASCQTDTLAENWADDTLADLLEKPKSEWTEDDWETYHYCKNANSERDYYDSLDESKQCAKSNNVTKVKKETVIENIFDLNSSTKRKCVESIPWGAYDDFEYINTKYLPATGEGDSKATQAVTAINKLVFKYYNDGDVYDNVNSRLEGWANDISSYANWLYKYLPETKATLDQIYDIFSESEYEDLLFKLTAIVLDEKLLDNLHRMPKIGSVYDCAGPFEFSDHTEEEEEDEYSDSYDSLDEDFLEDTYTDDEIDAIVGKVIEETYTDDELDDMVGKVYNIHKIENIYRRKKYGEDRLFAHSICIKCGRDKRVFLSNLVSDPDKYGSCICSDTNIEAKIDNIEQLYSGEKKIASNTSGFTGVSFVKTYRGKPYNKWRAYIDVDGERVYLGDFSSKNKAIKARKQAGEKGIKWYKDNKNKLTRDMRRKSKKYSNSKYRETAKKRTYRNGK